MQSYTQKSAYSVYMLTFVIACCMCSGNKCFGITISIDANASLPGSQSTATIAKGGSITIDILISDAVGISSFSNMTGHFADDGIGTPLKYDPAILDATSILDGTFLIGPFDTVVDSLDDGAVGYTRIDSPANTNPQFAASPSLVPNGLLFSVVFTGHMEGFSDIAFSGGHRATLDFIDPSLGIIFINSIDVPAITIEVIAVPEPSSISLLFGMSIFACLKRR